MKDDEKRSIFIEYTFERKEDKRTGVFMEVNVRNDISEEEAAQVLVRAYQNVASRVLQSHIVNGCQGCPACEMNTLAMRGIDKAYRETSDEPPF